MLHAGAGLPSILSARMGAKAVTLTDYDPKVLTFRGLDSVTHVPITFSAGTYMSMQGLGDVP